MILPERRGADFRTIRFNFSKNKKKLTDLR